jgi:BirA family biotin operon repressor/biotin-[acetyl-CoA-carboxylase] ligase
MGININQVVFPAAARNPVSLRQITGRIYDVPALARELGACLDRRYAEWEAGEKMIIDYNRVLYRLGQEVQLKKDNAVFRTRVEGVSPQGELLTKDVLERRFTFGEVEWVI